ncbi:MULTISPECIES: heavy-metal-associated domain-containing protein [unclassified Marinobacter]|jgi:copper chaperone CopZ|uniref:heavy-metal-associated domain-containing protein n=1 Tax=unclassified Marinobacter TaxID=83889 RepID=UPI0000F39B70|nr:MULTISPECIES: heavy-metal-associated domain-containing protein [unclassified Marinobacter]EAZ99703.1 putative Copper chaperone [Marinobacter sp. ELB17]PFG08559.1 copper chaperone CopZ [Marinobacter sp. LV10MA510-1]PFG54406.1 copper chaperone CopZ [Marinobacter sp. LV10R520-4]
MKTLLRSDELNCPSCITKIEKALGRLGGVTNAKVHFATGRIEVEHDAEQIKAEQLLSAVREVGYEARISAF